MRNPTLENALVLALVIVPVSANAKVAPPEAADPIVDQFDPVPIEATPLPAPLPEPQPEPEPVEPPAAAPIEGPTPAEIAKVETMRRASVGILATGGIVATTGLGLTIAFTILGHHEEDVEAPVVADIERRDAAARVGGIVLVSGIAVVAIGGILFVSARKKAESQATARLRVTPTIGGLVVSGRF